MSHSHWHGGEGGVRKLGVPCVVDRLIQQALLQVLQKRWDPTFSRHSYGFRPGRSAHQAIAQAQQYIAAGYSVVVDLDLEKFFDRVNHDGLMARVAARVSDKRVLRLIRARSNSAMLASMVASIRPCGVARSNVIPFTATTDPRRASNSFSVASRSVVLRPHRESSVTSTASPCSGIQ